MKGSGRMIRDMEWVMRGSAIRMFIKASIRKERSMDKASMYGQVESSMRGSGLKEASMGMESGKESKETLISVNGHRISLTGMENIYGVIKIHMKVNGSNA